MFLNSGLICKIHTFHQCSSHSPKTWHLSKCDFCHINFGFKNIFTSVTDPLSSPLCHQLARSCSFFPSFFWTAERAPMFLLVFSNFWGQKGVRSRDSFFFILSLRPPIMGPKIGLKHPPLQKIAVFENWFSPQASHPLRCSAHAPTSFFFLWACPVVRGCF